MSLYARPAASRRTSAIGRLCALSILSILLPAQSSSGQLSATNFRKTAPSGFGDRHNSYPWSMKWFKGNLYVGTNRDFQCVENATIAYYYPIVIPLQAIFADPDVPCPLNPANLDLRAEIWRYSPGDGQWTRIYQSDYIPGTTLARDIGYRDMQIFTEADGTEALYIVGCTAREFNPGTPPPRILRMTVETDPVTGESGEAFEAVPQDPGTVLGSTPAVTFRATAVYNNKFYVSASPVLTGNGFVLESANPRLGNNSFRQVTPTELQVYEMSVFNGSLYIGVGDQTNGYSVWKTDASGDVPYKLTPIVTGGAGRGPVMTSVVSMYPYRGRLYVGSAGWYSTLLPSSELIRINPNDSWELISGNVRLAPNGFIFPLSGLGDGFGNPFNAHIWRLQEHNGVLYAGTNDDSWALRKTPLAPFFQSEFGFDIFASPDGVAWSPVTRNGFGNLYNFGLRTFASTASGLFVGAVNYVQGCEVWLGGSGSSSSSTTNAAPASIGAPAAGTVGAAATAAPRPRPSTATLDSSGVARISPAPSPGARPGDADAASQPPPAPSPDGFEVEVLNRSAVLSWNPQPDAVRYHVFRSTFQKVDFGYYLGQGPAVEGQEDPLRPGETQGVFALPGPFQEIGTSTKPVFQDRKVVKKGEYSYYVRAEGKDGTLSPPSNTRSIPDLAPPATFARIRADLAALIAGDEATAGLTALVDQGRDAANKKDYAGARARLDEVRQRLSQPRPNGLELPAANPLDVQIARLARRLDLCLSGAMPGDQLNREDAGAHAAPRASKTKARGPATTGATIHSVVEP